MRESSGRGGIRQIVCRHIDGLYRGNRPFLRGCDSFLHTTHVGGEGGLVSDGRGNTTEKSRYFGTGLRETENVVDKEKYVLSFFVTEVFCDSQSCEGDSSTGTRRFVHLSEYQCSFGLAVEFDDSGFNHFVVQIVAFSGAFTDTCEYGVTTMGLCDVVLSQLRTRRMYNQFLDKYGFSDTGTAKETNFTASSVWGEEIDDFDTSFENFGSSRLVDEFRCIGVDGEVFSSFNGTTFIDGFTDDIHNTTECAGLWISMRTDNRTYADGNLDGSASGSDGLTTDKTFGTIHGNTSDGVLSKMLGDFKDESLTGW